MALDRDRAGCVDQHPNSLHLDRRFDCGEPLLDRGSIEPEPEPSGGRFHPVEVRGDVGDPVGLVAQRFEESECPVRPGQDPGLGAHFGVFRFGIGRPRDTAAGAVHEHARCRVEHGRADRNREDRTRPVTGWREHADRPAIHTPRVCFEFGDDVHRGDLRSARDRTAREQCGQHIDELGSVLDVSPHRRRQLPHGLVTLDREQIRHADGADARHPSEVVAEQVDDHHVLCPLLRRCQQCRSSAFVVSWARLPLGGALHRPALDGRALPTEEQLGRHRGHHALVHLYVGAERATLHAEQRRVHLQRCALVAPGEAIGHVHLVHVAGGDTRANRLDRVGVREPVRESFARHDAGLGRRRRHRVRSFAERLPPHEGRSGRWRGRRVHHRVERGRRLVGDDDHHPFAVQCSTFGGT